MSSPAQERVHHGGREQPPGLLRWLAWTALLGLFVGTVGAVAFSKEVVFIAPNNESERASEDGVEFQRLSADDPKKWLGAWIANYAALMRAPTAKGSQVLLSHMFLDPTTPGLAASMVYDRVQFGELDEQDVIFAAGPIMEASFSSPSRRTLLVQMWRRVNGLIRTRYFAFTLAPSPDGSEWLVEDLETDSSPWSFQRG